MIEKDLNKVLNYMKQYVENKYEHDSEPMLNWKDLKLVLDERDRLNNIMNRINSFVDRTIEIIKQQPTGDDEWILERLNGIKYLIELKEQK